MDQVYSYLEGRNINVVLILDKAMPIEDTALLDDIDLDLDLDSDGPIKDAEEEEIDLDIVDLLGGTGTEDPVRTCFKKIDTVPLLMTDEEFDLAQHEADGGKFAKERLVEVNLRLAVSIARRYTGRGMSFLDLVQEDNLGLIKGVEKFGYTKGYRLSIYTTWWIRQSVTRALTDQAKTVRVPVYMVETINKMSKVQRKLTLELGYEPSVTEPTETLDTTEDKVMEIMQITRGSTSLRASIDEEDGSNLGDFVVNNDAATPEDNVESAMLQEYIDAPLGDLEERERQVITLRFGLEDGHPRILEEVGKEFSVTRERIRQVEAKALRKPHNPVKSKRIRGFL